MHLTDEFPIAMRTFGDGRGWGRLTGRGRLTGEGSCIDRDLVSLALQQDGCAKDCDRHNQ